MWFYSCSYICNYLKLPKKSQINEYSDGGYNSMWCMQLSLWVCLCVCGCWYYCEWNQLLGPISLGFLGWLVLSSWGINRTLLMNCTKMRISSFLRWFVLCGHRFLGWCVCCSIHEYLFYWACIGDGVSWGRHFPKIKNYVWPKAGFNLMLVSKKVKWFQKYE